MPEFNRKPVRFAARVTNADGKVLENADVVVVSPDGHEVSLEFKEGAGVHAGEVSPGRSLITAAHDDLTAEERTVDVGSDPQPELFILAEEGVPTYFRETVRVPVTVDEDLIAVTLARGRDQARSQLEAAVQELGMEEQEVPDLARRSGMRLYRVDDAEEAVEQLRHLEAVEHVGAVVSQTEETFSHLTDQVVVRFQAPQKNEVPSLAREYGFTVERELISSPSTYVMRWERGGSRAILPVIEELAARDDVVWAEPSLVVSPMLDAITPGDTLWDGLWDRQLIGLPDAWQALQDAGLNTFGDPGITLAVWDSGTQTSGGAPTNGDFQGTLSDGTPKVKAVFDFENMVANNDNPWSNHGSGVAGVSVAKANNPTPASAAGVVGSAPNVGIMLVAGRVPYIDIEVADQYLWMAGFDPQSPIAGFPAPPPVGADVITCSLTPGAGAPLSGTARATLDFVTTFGRGGKGTLCFFSTGNQNMDITTWRPYGAYEKAVAIAATSLDDDGTTEIRGAYSGWGPIDFCAPSQDALGTVHNPPTGYMPWSAAHQGQGNLPSTVTQQTTLTAAAASGDTTITVASVTGFAAGGVIHLGPFGANGSEPAQVNAVNAATNQLTLQSGLLNAHGAGDVVVTGPAGHRNNFGGTSSATPLAAGVGALVLSASPSLTHIEAREILRSTAVKLDLANTDPVGQWLDANGDPSVTSGQPPVRSGWYGFGRIDAAAAVTEAVVFAAARDLVIRDNLADTGAVASTGAFWNSPDIWCRTTDPTGDPAAVPASYGVAGPHQSPVRGQTNWLLARVANNGTQPSLDAWVRASVTHFPGTEFTYPESFQPTNGPGDPLPSPLTPGTYFIGEAKVTALAPGADEVVAMEWPAALIPPSTVMTPGGTVAWHPCLLVEITPHDGPLPTGNHVWDDNNLAQKNISIVDADAGIDFASAVVLGSFLNPADAFYLDIHRGKLPQGVLLYVDLMDPVLLRRLHTCEPGDQPRRPTLGSLLEHVFVGAAPGGEVTLSPSATTAVALPPQLGGPPALVTRPPLRPAIRRGWKTGWHERREVVFLHPHPRVRLPICGGQGRLLPVVIGGIVDEGVEQGTYEVVLVQRQPDGRPSGSATVHVRIGQKDDVEG